MIESSYLRLARSGNLAERIEKSHQLLSECTVCPRLCRVNRLHDERGRCRTGKYCEVASYGPHFGEESVLVGENGSGTIFFCGCNLLCVFCQNYDISHPGEGSCSTFDDRQLGALMLDLQKQGCHNINLVTPSHVVPQILGALPYAIEGGLEVPLVYNCGGYERLETLRLLDGVIDIYMPDFKFWDVSSASRYMAAPDYPERAREALKEMQSQVGDLQISSAGLAERGLLVRHLLMPGGEGETEAILAFLAEEISKDCYLNIMDQYRPCGRSGKYPELNGSIGPEQYSRMVDLAGRYGLNRLDRKDFHKLMQLLFDR